MELYFCYLYDVVAQAADQIIIAISGINHAVPVACP